MDTAGGKLDFFISRAGEDAAIALWVDEALRDAGYTTIVQDLDILPGHSFLDKMSDALNRAERTIAIFSPHYVGKQFTLTEMFSTLAKDALGRDRLLIPIRVAECEVPAVANHIVYVDFVGKDADTRKRLLLDAVMPGDGRVARPAHRTSIASLPTVDPTLIGREKELAILDEAWGNPETNFIQIIAPGGTGKTALMSKWYQPLVKQTTVFGWSFYSQGTKENSQTSSDPFFAAVLPFFGIELAPTSSIWDKAEALARKLQAEKALLILDGMEPLQEAEGDVRDPGLKTLLKELAANHAGLVLCTTRVRIAEVPDAAPRAVSIELDNLSPEDGVKYLRHFGIEGKDEELREASEAYGNHALALTLLGTYLAEFCERDVRRRVEIPALIDEDTKVGQHARRVMGAYARRFEGKSELDILRALGYFDRPAEPEALQLVLPKIDGKKFRVALNNLHRVRLVLTNKPSEPIDCHPLVREHFAWVMRSTAAEEFRAGHSRLYEHYCKMAPERPDTLPEMTPLFYAVYHGCQAGRHAEARREVYRARILRGDDAYLNKELGVFGTDLTLLANFFQTPWAEPVSALTAADKAWVISCAAYALRALGSLTDAVAPMTAGAEADVGLKDWKNAAVSYGNLSELHLTIGNVREAVEEARQSVEFADRSEDPFEKLARRTTLADALQQSGDLVEAGSLFQEAERMQAEWRPEYPLLASLGGYQYCDLLLSQGHAADVVRRATQTLRWVEAHGLLLDIGLDHLSLGRAHPACSPDSIAHLNQAVEYLRRAGQLDYLPRALLARGKPHDLDEAFQIATRSGMRLFLADYHLIMARNLRSVEHFREAETLVAQTGYHRRDPELAQLRIDLGLAGEVS